MQNGLNEESNNILPCFIHTYTFQSFSQSTKTYTRLPLAILTSFLLHFSRQFSHTASSQFFKYSMQAFSTAPLLLWFLPDLHMVDFLSSVTFYLGLNAIFSESSDLTTMFSKIVSSLFLKTKTQTNKKPAAMLYLILISVLVYLCPLLECQHHEVRDPFSLSVIWILVVNCKRTKPVVIIKIINIKS